MIVLIARLLFINIFRPGVNIQYFITIVTQRRYIYIIITVFW